MVGDAHLASSVLAKTFRAVVKAALDREARALPDPTAKEIELLKVGEIRDDPPKRSRNGAAEDIPLQAHCRFWHGAVDLVEIDTSRAVETFLARLTPCRHMTKQFPIEPREFPSQPFLQPSCAVAT